MKRTVPLPALLAATLVATTALPQEATPPVAEKFESRTFTGVDGETLGYRLFKPANYDAKQKYPLVLFLHGAGERGSNNIMQLKHGMKVFTSDAFQAKHPCFIVAPQVPQNQKWSDVNWAELTNALPDKPSRSMALAMGALDSLQKQFSMDAKRLYITGISMGGYGTWDAISRWPDRFAAAAPVCGGGDMRQADKLTKIPIWCFHGDKDTAVPVLRSRNMIEAIKAAGGNPKYTEYPGVGHNSWDKAYADPELYDWMFAQKLQR